MTWARFDPGLAAKLDGLDEQGVPDSVARAHFEVLLALYEQEKSSARFYRRQLPRMTFVARPDDAAAHAIRLGIWTFDEQTDEYEIDEKWGGDTLRMSLAAQQKKRDDDKVAQRRKRERAKKEPASGTDVGSDAGTEVGDDVAATLTNKQANDRHVSEHEDPRPSLAVVANTAMSARAERHLTRGWDN